MRWKFVLIFPICVCLIDNFASSASQSQEENRHKKEITNYMKINEKFDFLSKRVNYLEENSSKENNAIAIALQRQNEKVEKMEQLLTEINNKFNTFYSQTSTKNASSICACDSKMCPWGGKSATSGGGSFSCSAERMCFRFRDTLYAVFEEDVEWQRAYDKCSSEGMRMAMPKSREQNEGLMQRLGSVYSKGSRFAWVHFWLGLKPHEREWRWNDGTPLGDYFAGYPKFKSELGERWAVLGLHGGNGMWWSHDSSDALTHTQFALCEKNI